MNDVERLLRQTLDDEAGRAPSASRLVDDLRPRLETAGHPWRRPALAATGIALVAAAVAAALLVGQRPVPVSPSGPGSATTQVPRASPEVPTSTSATTPASSVTTTIYGTSGSVVTSRVVTGPLQTEPVTVTITVSSPP
ncbi:hypothetical protein FHX52_3366 [Humibacillus xanthopallidus]|uniref:Uncharacterized protein n=1 Tax=Humibacillus xanthopallidus TaxID=412689 RepID=A0A543PRD4_9MICO|nr:hypothetical protein [Humibacillus xanthopallidus]TQN46637.1 hypothetical protein FHX52_3366 [Humibacillus xanthopallidus]